jgi:P-type Ca2+ transporter type 2C
MVLKDDSFASIVAAIRQGRAIFENIRKFVIYLLSCNVSELLIVAIASVLNFHFQLFPLQILFVNIVTDVLPALALGLTKADATIMARPPRNTSEPLIGKPEWYSIFTYSTVLTLSCLGAVLFCHFTVEEQQHSTTVCNNTLFYCLILSQLWHVLNMATEKPSRFFNNEIVKNKYVWLAMASCFVIIALTYVTPIIRKALSVDSMSLYTWSIALFFSVAGMVVNQVLKRMNLIR